MILTYKYRVKDAISRKLLCDLASKVNFVWNYINEINKKSYVNFKQGGSNKFLSAFDINRLLVGASKELNLHSHSINNISESYIFNRIKNKKPYLSWRSSKRSLGWIPFKNSGFLYNKSKVKYLGHHIKIYNSRNIPNDALIKCGSFNQDARGRWYVNITFEVPDILSAINLRNSVGIDLGAKNALTLSDKQVFVGANSTKKYENNLAKAQRASKKKQIKSIQAKIKNVRKDYIHKTTTKIAKKFNVIFVGDVKSQDIIDKSFNVNLTKGVYDSSWYMIKNFLEYKAKKLGGFYKEVNEAYTTQDCSECLKRCGPRGVEGLNIREWSCNNCGALHQRDINSAKNILRIGHDTLLNYSI